MSVRDNANRSQYEIDVDGERAGLIAYRRSDDVVTMLHTEVDDAHEGRGVGSQLVRGALDDVRANGWQVVPRCSFVAAWIERHPEYRDLVSSDA